jgi:hypothetical protein
VTFTVDIHHHMLPDFFWQATNEGDHPVGGIAPPPWSRASTLSFLDDAGIDVAITSISTPGVHTGDDAAARVLARRCNELAAGMIRDRPDRFGGFACLPLPDVDGALAELAYALDDLRLDGVLLFSNARGTYLGNPRFTPLFDELQRRRAGDDADPAAGRPSPPDLNPRRIVKAPRGRLTGAAVRGHAGPLWTDRRHRAWRRSCGDACQLCSARRIARLRSQAETGS